MLGLVALTVFRVEAAEIRLRHRRELLNDCERVLGLKDERTVKIRELVRVQEEWTTLPFYEKMFTRPNDRHNHQ